VQRGMRASRLRLPSLASNRDFTRLWIGGLVSGTGSAASGVVTTLLAFHLTGSTIQASFVGSLTMFGSVVMRIPAGTFADRYDRRKVLLFANSIMLAAVTSIAITLEFGIATIYQLCVCGLLLAAGGSLSGPAGQAALRTVVPANQLSDALSKNVIRNQAAALAGPPLGGFLYGVRRSLPFITDLASYCVAIYLILTLKTSFAVDRRQVDKTSRFAAEAVAGFKFIWSTGFLRAVTLYSLLGNLAGQMLATALILSMAAAHNSPTAIGALQTCMALSAITGATISPWLMNRFSPAVLAVMASLTAVPLIAAMAFTRSAVALDGLLAATVFLLPAANSSVMGRLFAITPQSMQGRASATLTFGASLCTPVAPIIAGFMLSDAGRGIVFISIAAIFLAAAATFAFVRGSRHLEGPEGVRAFAGPSGTRSQMQGERMRDPVAKSTFDERPVQLLRSHANSSDLPAICADLARRGPVIRIADDRWLITGFEECLQVLSSRSVGVREQPPAHRRTAHNFDLSFNRLNAPDHGRLRSSAAPAFSLASMTRLRAITSARAEDLIKKNAGQDRVDIIRDFAEQLPLAVIAELIGVADSRFAEFCALAKPIGDSLDGVRSPEDLGHLTSAWHDLESILRALFHSVEQVPIHSAVHAMRTAGRERISDDEAIAILMLLVASGSATTTQAIAGGFVALAEHPAEWEKLRNDPQLIRNAARETLRYTSPVISVARIALDDLELVGHPIRRGDDIIVSLGVGNHDPSVFTDPGAFVCDRDLPPQDLAFAHGVHRCIGNKLAIAEIAAALSAIVRHIRSIAIINDEERLTGANMRGWSSLLVQLMPF
jgi:cytochrome P450/fucose permease